MQTKVSIGRHYTAPPFDKRGQEIPKPDWPARRPHKWLCRWIDSTGTRKCKRFDTQKEARDHARNIEGQPVSSRISPKMITLQQYADELQELGIGGDGRPQRPRSVISTSESLAKLIAYLGPEIPLAKITPALATKWTAHLHKGGLATATANRHKRTAKAAFAVAVKHLQYLPANPFANVKQEREPDRPATYQSPRQLTTLLEAIDEQYAEDPARRLWWRTFALLLYTAGLRRNEALYLTWADIDFDAGELTVIARNDVLDFAPKGKRSRRIPLPEVTIDALAALQAEAPANHPYVLISPERVAEIQILKAEGKWHGASRVRCSLHHVWARLLKRAGLARCSFHDLRRSAITNWARVLPIHQTQEYAGHAETTTTQRYYLSLADHDRERGHAVAESGMRSPRI